MWRKVKVTQLCLTLCNPRDCTPPGFSVHGILQARILECVAIPFSRGPFQPRDWTSGSCMSGEFFTVWATREAKNMGVGSLSLLQGIFPTQESNQGLLNCRWISTSWAGSIYIPVNEDHGIQSHHFMGNRWRNSGNSVRLYFWGAPKSLQMVTAAMKLEDAYSLEEKLWPT